MDSISIIPGGNIGGLTEDTGVVVDNPNTPAIENGVFLTRAGSIQFLDSDTGAGIFHVPYATPIGATLGTLRVNIFNDATGGADNGFVDWTYAVDNTLVQYLAAGETRVESFDLLIVGYDGEEQHTTISVTLTGTNDAVVISSPANAVTLGEDAAMLSSMGSYLFNDIDTRDTHSASVAVAISGDTNGLALSSAALAALLSTNVTSTTTANNGSVAYSFAGSNADFQYLRAGETLTLTYTIAVNDGNGSTANQTFTVNIVGSNDAPTITAATTQGGIIEAGASGVGTASVSGDASNGGANWIDLDHGNDATLAITQGSFGAAAQAALTFDGSGVGALAGEATLAGIYGALYLKADGTYRYVLDNALTVTQALDDGAAPNEIFNYTILSDDGFTAASTISINVAGSNDAPALSAITSPAAFTEAANAAAQVVSASGTFTVTDVDGNDTLTPVVSGAVVRLNGNVINSGFPAALIAALNITPGSANSDSGALNSFNWAYAPGAANLDFLSVTDTLTITYPVSVSDGTTASGVQNIVITINGTNDAPAISLSLGDAYSGSVTETNAGGLNVSDTFTVTDLDLNDAVVGTVMGVSATGFTNGLSNAALQAMFTITAGDLTAPGSNNGLLTWTFNSGAQAFNFLNVGETLTLDYTVQVNDGHGGIASQIVTVTVNGTNDVPTVNNDNIVYLPVGDAYNSIANAYQITGGYSLDANPEIYNSTTVPHISFYVQSDAVAEYFSFVTPNFSYTNSAYLTVDIDTPLGGPDAFISAYLNGSLGFTNDSDSFSGIDAVINPLDPALRLSGNGNGLVLTYRIGTAASSGAVGLGVGNGYILNFSNAAYTGPLVSSGPRTVVESNSALTATGAITFADADHGDVVTASYVAANDAAVTAVGATLTPAQILDIKNAFSVTTAGAFTFSLASPDYLATGETITAVYTVHGTDTHGGATTQNVTYTIVGTNDAPTFTSGPASVTLGEDTALSATGTLAFNDVDVTDVHTLSPLTVVASGTGNNAGLTLTNAQLLALLTPSVTSTAAVSTGSVGYSFAATNPAFQYLRDGQTLTLTYTIGVNDGHGGTASQTVTINVTGSNDGPVAVADVNGADVVIESGIDASGAPYAGDPTATGNLLTNDTDLDFGDTQTVTTTGTFVGTYGAIVIASNGSYTYTLNNGDATTNALAVGAAASDVFAYTMTDTFGAVSSNTITISLTGTNDAPAFSGAAVTASFTEDATLSTSGTLNFNDVDVVDTHNRTVAVAASGTTAGLNLTNAQLLALFTSNITSTNISAAGSVAWSFAGNNPAFQYLATGESVVLTYSVAIDDGNGGTASKDVTVTITGVNDTPVITSGGTITGGASEAITGNTTVNLSGSFAVTDVDLTNNLTLTEGATSAVWSGGTLPAGVTNALTAPGAFVISDGDAASNAATVNWTLAPGALDLNFLAAGETIIVTVPVTINDGFGGSVVQNVVVTITGTNDVPFITNGGDTGSIAEVAGITGPGATLPASLAGDFTVADADQNGTTAITASFGGFTTNYGPRVTLTAPQQAALTAGLTFGPIIGNDGTVTWAYSVSNSAVDFLIEGEILTATINVNVDDGAGGIATTTVAVTITGTNDAVQAGVANLTGAWLEGAPAAPAITGTINYTDADFQNHGLQTINTGTGTLVGAGGTFTVSNAANSALDDGNGAVIWSYSLAPGAADYLAVGQTATEVFRVRIIDGAGFNLDQNVTVTITGTNDAPVISSPAYATTQNEDAPPAFSSGTFLFNDVDVTDVHTASVALVASGDIGGLTASNTTLLAYLNTNVVSTNTASSGSVTYNWTPNNAPFQYLQISQTLTLTYTITVADGNGGTASQTVTVNISGSNDGPVAVMDNNAGDVVIEAGFGLVGDGVAAGNVLTNDTDIDFGDTAAVAGVVAGTATGPLATGTGNVITGTYGTITIAPNGSYTYTLDDTDGDTQALDAGDTALDVFSYTVIDSQGATSTNTVTISVGGTNDAPVIAAITQPTAIVEAVTASAQDIAAITGTFVVTDVDANDTLTPSVAAPVVLLNGNPINYAVPAALLASLVISPASANSASGTAQTFNWSYDPAAANLDFLNVGQTLTIRYPVTISDGTISSTAQFIDITITGTNDAPYVIAPTPAVMPFVVPTGNLHTSFATALNIDGGFTRALNADIDISTLRPHTTINATGSSSRDVYSFTVGTVPAGGTRGIFDIDHTTGGSDTYIFLYDSNGNILAQSDDFGGDAGNTSGLDSYIDYLFATPGTYYIAVSSFGSTPNGGVGSGAGYQLHVGLDYHNVNSTSFSTSLTETNAMLTTTGTVAFGDVDNADFVTAGYAAATDANISATGATLTPAQITAIANAFGVGSGGDYTFALASPDYLAAGETVTAVFTVYGSDRNGASVSQNVTITITGTNDGPAFISGPASNSLGEDASLTSTGTLNFNDVDVSDVHTLAPLSVVASGTGNSAGLALTNAQLLSLLSTTITSTAATSNGSVGYTFTGSNPAFQYLNAGETLILTYTIGIDDGHSGTAYQTVTINITGSNDVPTITAATVASALAEDGTVTAAGDASLAGANWNDVDFGQDAVLALTQGSAGAAPQAALVFNGLGLGALANEATMAGTYGTLYLKADGTYRYLLNNSATATQALDSGQTASDVFNYTISDGVGGTAVSTITANIAGDNDAATITTVDRVDVTESNGTALVSFLIAGQVTITDIDTIDAANPQRYIAGSGEISGSGPNPFEANVNDLVTFNAATGAVSYDRAAFNYLGGSDSVTYTVTFVAQSGNDGEVSQSVSFTINGQNDLPVLVADTGSLAENVGGNFDLLGNDSDADLSDTLTLTAVSIASVTGLGSLTPAESADIANDFAIVGNQLVFTPATGLPGTQAVYDRLSPGQTATIIVTYSVSDGSSTTNSTFTLTLTGAAENFEGTPLDDNPFNGSSLDDIMHGNNGDDVIFGNSGNDTLYGDQGNDTINGGSGNDALYGGPGSDSLIGGSDIDTAYMEGTWASYTIAAGVIPGTYTLTRPGEVDTLTTIELVSFNGGAPVAIATILNDAPVVTGATYALTENIAGPVILGTITATDADTPLGDVIAFSITGGNEAGRFTIDAVTGVVSLASGQTLDREISASYGLTVTATDIHGATGTALVTVNVGDVNDNVPVFSSGATGNVNENAVPATVVYDANATDADATFGAIIYTLGGVDAAAFNIDSATGEVRLNVSADYETRTSYAITVTATQGATATTQAVSVSVNDLNDNAPVFSSATTASIAENALPATVVYDANATDADVTFGPITYTLTGVDAAAFNIDAATGEVRLNASADYETRSSYAINLVATQGTTATSRAVSVAVTDINDNNPVFSSGTTAAVLENNPVGSVVYDANATDADASFGPITYTLGGTDAAAFNIDGVTGEVRLNASADYEVRTSYAINVVATQGTTATTRGVTVNVTDANDNNPVFTSGTTASVNENAPAASTIIYDANATDADVSFGPISYSLSGADAAAFNIDTVTGEVRLNASADYETRSSYAINVVATQGATSTSQAVTVSVNDLNDNNPVFTSGATASVDENAPATTLVYDANATDADASFGPITFALGGADAAAFNIDAVTGEVRLNAGANYEVRTSYAINVIATQGATSTTRGVTVSVNDLNDNNPVFSSGASASIAENAAVSTVVYDANATDADATFGAIVYSLTGTDASAFNINAATGEVRLNNSANYEVRNSYAFSVVATQGATATTQAVTLSVSDVNEFAVGAIAFAGGNVNEIAPIGVIVGSAVAVDQDGTASVTYSLDNNAGGRFAINSVTGQITVADGILLDFEQSPVHNVTVRATSSDGSTSVGTSAITLNNISPELVIGTGASETVMGGAGNDTFIMNGGNDFVRAGGGNDILNGGAGSDRLIGGTGIDTAVYAGALAASGTTILRGANGVIIVNDGVGNVDMLRGIEQIQFADITVTPTGYARSDLNGDGTSDIISYSDTTGLITRTNILTGAQTGAGTLGNLGTGDWDIQATGDFNYDGTADLVLKNAVTGQFYVWTVTNGVQTGGFNLGVIGTNWNILNTGDFNRDGNHDVLWRNTNDGHLYVWTFDASGHQTGGASLGVLGTNWTGAGVGDFNGDGSSDVVLRNADNGRLYVYTLNGGQLSGGYDLNTFGTDWVVGGVGDFNGDGISDIALKNNVSGQFYILQSNTTGSYAGSDLGIIGTNFNIASVGDYNHDGVDDILLRNSVTNQVTLMAMEDGHQAATGSGAIGIYASDLIIV